MTSGKHRKTDLPSFSFFNPPPTDSLPTLLRRGGKLVGGVSEREVSGKAVGRELS